MSLVQFNKIFASVLTITVFSYISLSTSVLAMGKQKAPESSQPSNTKPSENAVVTPLAKPKQIPCLQAQAKAPDHLRYYAPFSNGENIHDTQGYSNLFWLGSINPKLSQQLAAENAQAIMEAEGTFFSSNNVLRTDYVARWRSYYKKLEPYKNQILALYIVDEPFLFTKTFDKKSTTTWSQMKSNLEKITQLVHETWPEVKLVTTFSSLELQRGEFSIPRGLDWVSFDCYDNMNNCDGKGSSVEGLKSRLRSFMNKDQRMFLIPQAFVWTNGTQGGPAEIPMIQSNLKAYYCMAIRDRMVIGIFPFAYTDRGGLTGYGSYSEIESVVAKYGKKVLQLH